MRAIAQFGALVAALALTAPAGAGFGLQSWADLDHGWAVSGTAVYSTDNGGGSWRPIFYGGNQIYRVERTSASAGTVVSGNSHTTAFWTRDGGKHWYRTSDEIGNAVGHGGLLFSSSGSVLLQERPWPPRGIVRCHGTWWGTAFGPATSSKTPRNVCSGPAPSGVRSQKVYTLAKDTQIASDTLTPVPAGIAAVGVDGSPRARPLEVLMFRNGRGLETPLPSAGPPDAGFSGLRLEAAWPSLTVQADAAGAHVTWRSADGGATWTVVTG